MPTYFTNDPDRHLFVNVSHSADRHSLGLGGRLTVPPGTKAEASADCAWLRGKNNSTIAAGLSVSVAW